MPIFKYRALDRQSNKQSTGQVEALSIQDARQRVTAKNLIPIDIKEVKPNPVKAILNKPKRKDLAIFSRQLSTLVSAGLPILASLRNVAEQTTNSQLKEVGLEITKEVSGGKSLAEAIAKYPDIFDPTYVSLIQTGEESGKLDVALEKLSDQSDKDSALVRKIISALVYPIIVIVVLIAIIAFMMVVVIPEVKTIYEQFGGLDKLPFITKLMIAMSEGVVKYWMFVLVGLVGSILWIRWYSRTNTGRRQIDDFKLRIPFFGTLIKKFYMTQFARTASILIGGGVAYVQALENLAEGINNHLVSADIKKATEAVKGGSQLSTALEDSPYFLPTLLNLISIGEESGTLEEMLERAADVYEKEVENQIETLTNALEPALIVVVGIFGVFVIFAVLLPIYNLVGNNQIG